MGIRSIVFICIVLALAPWALAISFGFPPRALSDELAAGLGLVALAILMLEFFLSGRFRIVSRHLGLDVTIRAHQLLARFAAAFLLLHPFIYTTPILNYPLPDDLTRQFMLGLAPGSLVTGLLAWLLCFVLIVTAVFRDQIGHRYEVWRRAHGVGALLIVTLSSHHAIAAGRYSGEKLLASVWVILLAGALLSLVWVYIVRPLQQLRRPYQVGSIRKVARRTWELVIVPIGEHVLPYKAGQFVWLKVDACAFSLAEHPFSISSAPANGPSISFVIKELGDFTNQIGEVRIGARAYLDGPHGHLSIKGRKGAGVALVAGGVGIAPLLGILRQMASENDPRPVILVYGNRTADQIAYADELDDLGRRLNLKVDFVVGEPEADWPGRIGQLDSACIRSIFNFPEARHWLYVLCGPPQMIAPLTRTLTSMGVSPRNLISERFNYD